MANIPLYIYIPYLLYPFICLWTFSLLLCLGYCKQCCYEHWDACIFFELEFSLDICRGGIARSYINSIFRNLSTVFYSGCTNWHSHQQCRRGPLCPHWNHREGYITPCLGAGPWYDGARPDEAGNLTTAEEGRQSGNTQVSWKGKVQVSCPFLAGCQAPEPWHLKFEYFVNWSQIEERGLLPLEGENGIRGVRDYRRGPHSIPTWGREGNREGLCEGLSCHLSSGFGWMWPNPH